jgi:hypothetical protein
VLWLTVRQFRAQALVAAAGVVVLLVVVVQHCVHQLHLTDVIRNQPASRYWPFQIEESLLCVALALLLAGLSLWWVRRRIS